MHKARRLALTLAIASLAGCGTGIVRSVPLEPSQRPTLAASLEQVLPALEADRVELWQSQPCRALETRGRGHARRDDHSDRGQLGIPRGRVRLIALVTRCIRAPLVAAS